MIDLRIEKDAVRAGEKVRGKVYWTSPDGKPAKSLSLHLELDVAGWGDGDERRLAPFTIRVPEGGSTASSAFELSVPREGPVSYKGRLMTVSWHVRARADIPWGTDERAGKPLRVVAHPPRAA